MHLREPRYLYGLDEADNLIHVQDASSGSLYLCPGCSARLVAHKNGQRQQHFKHFHSDACTGETYLHALAKRTFIRWYQDSLASKHAVLLELPREVVCNRYASLYLDGCTATEVTQFNLIRYFDEAVLEATYGRFRPDILLRNTSNNEVLFVEIAVTHTCEQEKIDSGNRIIEFEVQTEDDLVVLTKSPFLLQQPKITLYNFSARPFETNQCSDRCALNTEVFLVNEQGVIRTLKGTRQKVGEEIIRLNPIEIAVIDIPGTKRQKLRDMLLRAGKKGLSRMNCYLCAEARGVEEVSKVYCGKKFKVFSYTEAERCGFYKEVTQ